MIQEIDHGAAVLATLSSVPSLGGLSYLDSARVYGATDTVVLRDFACLYETALLP